MHHGKDSTTLRVAPLAGPMSALLLWQRGVLLPSQQKAEREALRTQYAKKLLCGGARETWALTGVFFFFNHLLGLPKFPFHCTRINIRRYITACMHISIQSRGGGQFVRSLYILGTCVRQRLTCGKKRILCTTKSIQIRNQHCPLSGKEKKKSEKKSSITTEVRHLASFASGH